MVIRQKHGQRKAKTDKICKFFIDAIEKSKYGWFWKCPNNEDCIYRHALPDGWKLRSKTTEKKNLTLEDVIEKERMKLTGELTPLTKDLFDAWKEKWLKRMKDDKDNEIKKELASKKKDKKFLDPNFKFLSGRSMFVYNPNDALDEEGDDDDNDLQELIRNRKKQNIDGDEEEEGNQLIDDVELPDDDFNDDLVDNCEMPDDID